MSLAFSVRLSAIAALGLTAIIGTAQQAEPPKPAQVSFRFVRPGLEVPEFTIAVNEDGSGRYQAEQVSAGSSSRSAVSPSTQHIDRAISLSPATTRAIFAAARELNHFTDPCASPAKNVADTGKKILRYTGEGGEGACTYNYSEDKRVVLLADTFQSIAATLDFGRKLSFDHRFDRLGLDADIARLVQEVDAGHAIELETIANVLGSIADDADLLERVRSRAAKLLQQTQTRSQAQPRSQPAS